MTNKKFSKINLFIRSSIFWLYSVTSIILYSIVCVFAFVFPLSIRYKLIRAFLMAYFFMLKKICHIDYRIEGLENIPKDRPGIIMSKHQSTLETFLIPIYFHDPAIIAKRELMWIPFFGWGLAVSDPISINRSDRSSSMQQIITKGRACLNQGRWIMMFPEGTRVPPGTIGHYKLGGGRLAAATGAPVIPIAHNAGRFWPRRKFIKRPGTVTMVIGPVIESTGKTPEEILQATKDWIESTMLKIDARFINETAGQ